MKKLVSFLSGIVLSLCMLHAQDTVQSYIFTDIQSCKAGPVVSQGSSGTCWCFSTQSFLESELVRLGKPMVNFSEMYSVYHTYLRKAENYIRRHGTANFDEGSLGHDAIFALEHYGMVPESEYSGLREGQDRHDHGKMVKEMKKYLKKALKKAKGEVPENWEVDIRSILNEYLGTPPATGQRYGLNPDDYISFTSFSHQPWYEQFVLEVPDNWSNGTFYNLPMNELQQLVEHALREGYTVTWDGDVSEKGFSARRSLAIYPADPSEAGMAAAMNAPSSESEVSTTQRQKAYDMWDLTDDHLMHITGLAKDQNGKLYYKVKNSWGPIGPGQGFLYMSQAYFSYGTISILLHKDAVPNPLKEKLEL
ncbi:MAG: C1 family peptidase [Bacteroidia bacterium]